MGELGGGHHPWQDDVELTVSVAKVSRPRIAGGMTLIPVPPVDHVGTGSGAPPGWELNTNSVKSITITKTEEYTQILPTSTGAPLTTGEFAGIRTITPIPVVASQLYDFGAYVSDVFGAAGGHPFEQPALVLDWVNGAGTTFATTQTLIVARGDDPPAWRRIRRRMAPPVGAVSVRIRVIGFGGTASDAYGMQLRVSQVYMHQWTDDPDEWHDVSCDVQAVEMFEGRSRFTDRPELAQTTVQLRNDDGRYSYGVAGGLLDVGRAVQITATERETGITMPFAFGFIEQAPEAYDRRGHNVVNVAIRDTTSLLSAAGEPAPSTPATGTVGETFGARLEHLSQYVRWHDTETDDPALAPIQLQAWQRNRNLRDEAGIAADSIGGYFYAERDGRWYYVPPAYLSTDTFVNATFVADDLEVARGWPAIPNALTPDGDNTFDPPIIPVQTALPDWSLARVVNEVKLARAGGTTNTYRDETSIGRYGVQSYQRLDLITVDDADFDDRAALILDALSDARLRMDAITYRADLVGRWWRTATLTLGIGKTVRVNYRNPQSGWWMSLITRVQSIRHRIDVDSWTVQLSLDEQWSPAGRFGPAAMVTEDDEQMLTELGLEMVTEV